jgi:predicted nucleic acid-binding protein
VIYVLDAAAVVDLLVRSDPGELVRRRLAADQGAVLLSVAHLDAEVFSALARLHRAGGLDPGEVTELLERLASMEMRRIPITGKLLGLAWDMRDNVAARDALYVAVARGVDGALITTDERLARAVPDIVVSND